jgi:hypothetical protein
LDKKRGSMYFLKCRIWFYCPYVRAGIQAWRWFQSDLWLKRDCATWKI